MEDIEDHLLLEIDVDTGILTLLDDEENISGGKSNKDGPVLQEALSFCLDNSIDIILVSELSRLGRKCDEILETI